MQKEILVVKEEGHKQLANSGTKPSPHTAKLGKYNNSIKANENNYENNVDLFPFLKMLQGEMLIFTTQDKQATTPILIPDVTAQAVNDVNTDGAIINGNITQEAGSNKEIHKKNGQPFEAGGNSENIILQVLSGTPYLPEKSSLFQGIMGSGNVQKGDNSLLQGDALLEGKTSVQDSITVGQEVAGTNSVTNGNYVKKLIEASTEGETPFSGISLDILLQREDTAIMHRGEITGDTDISHSQIRAQNETPTIRSHNLPLDIEKYFETDLMAIDGPQTMSKMIERVLNDKGYSDNGIVAMLADIDIKQLSLIEGEHLADNASLSFNRDTEERISVRPDDTIAVPKREFSLRTQNETPSINLHNLLLETEEHIETDSMAINRPQTISKIIEHVLKNKGYNDDEIVAILEDIDIKQISLLKGENLSATVKKIEEIVTSAIKNDQYGIQELHGEQVRFTDFPKKLPLADSASLLQREDLAAEQKGVDKLEIQGLEKPLLKNVQEEAAVPKLGAYSSTRDDVQKDTGMLIQKEKPAMSDQFSSTGRGDLALPADGLSIMKEQKIAFVRTESFIERIADLLPQVAYSGSGRLKIIVSPPNLGSIDMDIMVRENTVQVIMRAENRDVQQMLQVNVEQLKSALQQQGLQVNSFDVFLQSGRYALPGESGRGNAFWRDVRQERRGRNGQAEELSPSGPFLSIRGKDLIEVREGISIFA